MCLLMCTCFLPTSQISWRYIKKGIKNIYKKGNLNCYVNLRTHINKFCTNGYKQPLNEQQSSHCEKLYSFIEEFLECYVTEVQQKYRLNSNDEDSLVLYTSLWESYQNSSRLLNSACVNFNNYWLEKCTPQKDGTSISKIYQLAMVIWRRIMFMPLSTETSHMAARYIRKASKDVKYMSVLQAAIDCFVEMGFDKKDTMSIYKECFEAKFLRSIFQLCKRKRTQFLENSSLMAYLSDVGYFKATELLYFKYTLPPTTREKLDDIFNKVFNPSKYDIFCSEFKNFLQTNDIHELEKIYKLTKAIFNDADTFEREFENYTFYVGMSILQDYIDDTRNYISAISEFRDKYKELLSVAFKDDSKFKTALDSTCQTLLRSNSEISANSTKLLLNYFSSSTFSNSSCTEVDMEESDGVMTAKLTGATYL